MTGIVFDIQAYCLHDGPGIRSCVFLKGCPLRCAWCHNPESQRAAPEMGWWPARCSGCGGCLQACPQGALLRGPRGLVRDAARCSGCGTCAAVCPSGAQHRIGQPMPAAAVAERVARDAAFYRRSGGGVTISGGEPGAQPEFLLALLDALGARGLHRAVETCGCYPAGLLAALAPRVELFLYDLKPADDAAHRAGTGRGNGRILANLAALVARVGPQRVLPRVALIPGFNADAAAAAGLAEALAAAGCRGPVELLAYNSLARGKYRRLGRGRPATDRRALDAAGRERFAAAFAQRGFAPRWS
jgi:pyruvate formate lyase activating enzyme